MKSGEHKEDKNMTKYIHQNTISGHRSASGKALYLTVRFGTSAINDRIVWLPMSQLKIGEANECGWSQIEIPDWLIKKNSLQRASFIELEEA